MSSADWSREEVEAIVDDYLSMLASELAGTSYNKSAHRRLLKTTLNDRSDQSIEFKHSNVSAALVDRPIVVPEVADILAAWIEAPKARTELLEAREPSPSTAARLTTNYIEREARNRSLGGAGELFAMNFERARLIHEGCEALAAKVEHVAKTRGDHVGFDILSYERTGVERLAEVKTTQYGIDTPFYVTRNEVATSDRHPSRYHVYRLFSFRARPQLYALPGAIGTTCRLSAATFLAMPK